MNFTTHDTDNMIQSNKIKIKKKIYFVFYNFSENGFFLILIPET